MNAASYIRSSTYIKTPGPALFRDVIPVNAGFRGFALEGIPNRDSLKYIDVYGLQSDMVDMFRGTLRYQGTCELLDALKTIGFFNTSEREDIIAGNLEWVYFVYLLCLE
jgi:alpha-aminoadipic semialdehyde synthase